MERISVKEYSEETKLDYYLKYRKTAGPKFMSYAEWKELTFNRKLTQETVAAVAAHNATITTKKDTERYKRTHPYRLYAGEVDGVSVYVNTPCSEMSAQGTNKFLNQFQRKLTYHKTALRLKAKLESKKTASE